jgi:hypothetical protein
MTPHGQFRNSPNHQTIADLGPLKTLNFIVLAGFFALYCGDASTGSAFAEQPSTNGPENAPI